MELAKLEKKLPVKSYPEQELNKVVVMHFTPWLASLLSLTGETSVDRLEMALPAIKEHCWSMGFDEIKKMFEMYADNKLSIEPTPNYFDRILFGKIVHAYKQQKPVKRQEISIPEISEAEKKLKIKLGVLRLFDEYKEFKDVGTGVTWVYDHLDELGLIKKTKEEKIKAMTWAKSLEKGEVDHKKPGARNIMEMISQKNSPRVINRAKRILLNDYFENTDRETLKNKL